MIIKINNVGYDLEELLKTKTKVSNGMISAFSKNNKHCRGLRNFLGGRKGN